MMTEHLPECPWFPNTHDAVTCRDAETLVTFCEVIAKVREDERSNNFTPDDHANGMTEAYQRGLDAAQEAVDALTAWPEGIESDDLSFLNYLHGVRDALTAIDALKEKQ